jgi:hypothetical protein
MKFFTPELYGRMQRCDAQEMDAADAEWEDAVTQYERRLAMIREKLPESALKLLDGPRFHDADVLWMGQAGPFFGILAKLETPFHGTVLLTYRTVDAVQFDRDAFHTDVRSSAMQWMYDEMDLGRQDGSFHHSVLFSNGNELHIEAHDIQFATVDTLYAPRVQSKVPA